MDQLTLGMMVYWFSESGEGGRYAHDKEGWLVNWDRETLCIVTRNDSIVFRPRSGEGFDYPSNLTYFDDKYKEPITVSKES